MAGTVNGQCAALLDRDPQGMATDWYGRCEAGAPPLQSLPVEGERIDLTSTERGGVGTLVIDTPAGVPAFLPDLLANTRIVPVPVAAANDSPARGRKPGASHIKR